MFARSRGGADPVNCLWRADATTGHETLVADPTALLAAVAGDDADLPAEERARRERMREGAGGVTSYALSKDASLASFALAGQLFTADLDAARARHVPVDGPIFDPRPAPGATPDDGRDRLRSGPPTVGDGPGGRRSLLGDRAGRPRHRDLGQCRLHRRRGDGPTSRLLVVARRRHPGRVPRRRRTGAGLAHLESGRSRLGSERRPVSRCGHTECRRLAAPRAARRRRPGWRSPGTGPGFRTWRR